MRDALDSGNALSQNLDAAAKLPTLPAVAARILDTLRKEGFSSKELADLISVDPALSIKILGLANSPFYSPIGGIDSVYRAIDILGINIVRNLALSFSIIDGMKANGPGQFDYLQFWKQSIIRAVAAASAAKLVNRYSDEIFIVGLLADIGKLLMTMLRPDDYLDVQRDVNFSGVKDYESERRIFSYSHDDIGSETLKIWGIPEIIYRPIAMHHKETDDDDEYRHHVLMISIGDMVSDIYFGDTHQETIDGLCSLMNDRYLVDMDSVRSFIDDVASVGSDIMSNFDMPDEQLRPYSQLLQEANEEMFKMSLTYDQLLRRYSDEKEKAARLAGELTEANRRLRELAITDGLTGLYNFRYFHAELQKEMARARRHRHSVSLVMLDIDDFKQINDNFGHLSGDIVLKTLAGLIWRESRNVDTVARYGGEEFSLILPETDLRGAAVVAEKLRKLIEATPIEINALRINVTVSLGISVYDPQKNESNENDFIRAADRALYNSKGSGKNRLSISAP